MRTATLKIISAVASLRRLSPFSTVAVFRGTDGRFSIATAAAASGGDTIAPSANAAASGRPASATPTHATATVVTTTAPTASANSGIQYCRIARTGKSYAASTIAGAMNSTRTRCGSSVISGAHGSAATQRPAAASIVG